MSWHRKRQAPAFNAATMFSGFCEAARITGFTPGLAATTFRTSSFVAEMEFSTPVSQTQLPCERR